MADLDLTRLRCFVAVAEEKHFSHAAVRMHMTPPPLSRQIKRLERELGGTLFVRNYHDVQLTPLAESILPVVRDALIAVDSVAVRAAQLTGKDTPVRAAVSPFAPLPVIDSFTDFVTRAGAMPTSGIIMDFGTLEMTKRLESGDLDLALVHLPLPGDGFSTLPWQDYPLGVAVRSDDVLASRDDVTLEDLRGRRVLHPLAGLQPWVMDVHRQVLSQHGIEADMESLGGSMVTSELASLVWARRVATFIPMIDGALLSRMFVPPEFRTLPIVGEGLTMRTGLAWRRRRSPSPGLDRVIALAKDDRPDDRDVVGGGD